MQGAGTGNGVRNATMCGAIVAHGMYSMPGCPPVRTLTTAEWSYNCIIQLLPNWTFGLLIVLELVN